MAATALADLLTFEAGGEKLAIDAAELSAVINLPHITRVPNAAAALAGVANVRGLAAPILSVSALRGRGATPGKKVLILDRQPPVGLLVDAVTSIGPKGSVERLDLSMLLSATLHAKADAKVTRGAATRVELDAIGAVAQIGLLIFTVGRQEFALQLDHVKEALDLTGITPLPRSDAAVVGTMSNRGQLLPVLSLGALLSIPEAKDARRRRIVVAAVGGRSIGMVVDDIRSIARVSETLFDPVPALIARRASESRIQAICRLDDGRRLVSVIDATQLLQGMEADKMPEAKTPNPSKGAGSIGMTEPFVVFTIASQAFGLPAACVEEIVRRPQRFTKVPRAPDFVLGVMNLRGRAVPIIDQRARFGAQGTDTARDRIIVVSLGDLRAGFVVDEVREITRLPNDAVTPAPIIADGTKVFDRVGPFHGGEQVLLLIDPGELLSESERRMLIALRTNSSRGS